MVKKRTWALSLLFLTLFIFSVSLIAVGATVHNQRIKGFVVGNDSTCTPSVARVIECSENQWLAVWDEYMIEDVYAAKPTQELALANLNDYRLNHTYPCLCSPVTGNGNICGLYHRACYFNINATRAVVQTQMIYKYGSDASISVGCLIFLSMVIIVGILLYRERKKNDFVIMTGEE